VSVLSRFPDRMLRKPGRYLVALLVAAASLLADASADRRPGTGRPRTTAPTPRAAAAEASPNIILILTDDQDVQLASGDYMPRVKKLLVEQGVSFTNFFVPLSLCCPSRTTILRGQYPHNTGVLTNNLPNGGFEKAYASGIESATVATILHDAGYRTALLGKYLNGYPETASPTYIPPGWDEWYSPSAGNPYTEYNYTLNENGRLRAYGETPADYLTDVMRDRAADFIQRAAASPKQPLFVYFATYAPHEPFTPAPRHSSLFPNVTAPRPPSFNEEDVSAKPEFIRRRPPLTPAQIAGIDEDYRNRVRSLQSVDEAVAAMLDALAATGRLSNTYVFFTSDNGFHMGEHRLMPGKYTPYETDIHVPLIVRGPGVPAGVVRSQLAVSLDLAETFADLAGVPPLPFSDGRSLKSLLAGAPPATWREAVLLEEFERGMVAIASGAGRRDPASKLGIREPADKADILEEPIPVPSYYGFQTPSYKFVEYLDESGSFSATELYTTWDTFELDNLAARIDPAFANALKAYVALLIQCKADGCRSAEAAAPPALPGAFLAANTALAIDDQPGDRRYAVQVSYSTSQGGGLHGTGRAVAMSPVGLTRGGAFWFFSPDNPELLVKILDGCSANGAKWFFASAATNVGFTLTVTDTTTGAQRVYTNPDRNPAAPIQDTSAFPACP
jgi:N-acetylglucosamine-6-sulfatase